MILWPWKIFLGWHYDYSSQIQYDELYLSLIWPFEEKLWDDSMKLRNSGMTYDTEKVVGSLYYSK